MANLKEVRKAKGWTQIELAKVLKISNTTLSLIENGKVFPNKKTRDIIQKVLKHQFIQWYDQRNMDASQLIYMVADFVDNNPHRALFLIDYIERWCELLPLDILEEIEK